MKKSFLLFSFTLLGTLAAGVAFASPQAYADRSGDCYFGAGQCSVSGNGAYGTNDVLPGRTSASGPNALAGVNNKSTFIAEIQQRLGGGTHAKKGAQFIMKETTGTTDFTTFKNKVNQNSVSVTTGNRNVTRTSWYDSTKKDFFYDNYAAGSKAVVIIKQYGKEIAWIEVGCGNMTQFPGIIVWDPKWDMNANSTRSASPRQRGQSVTFTHTVWNIGPDTTDKKISGAVYWSSGTTGPVPSSAKFSDGRVKNASGNALDYDRTFKKGTADKREFTPSFTIPSNAKDGDIYCQQISVSDRAWNNHSNFRSNDACVTVDVPSVENDPTGSIVVACSNPATSRQKITYSFNDPDGVATGSISSTAGYSASNLAETGSATAYHQPDTGGKTYTLTVTNPKAAGGLGTPKTFSATSPSCSPGAMNEISPDVELSSSVIEPGQPLTATAEVECNPGTSTSTSNYHRIFWYENGGNVSRFDNPSDVLVSPAPNDESSPPVAAKTYCTASNPFAPWGPITIPPTGVTRVCTSLQLTNPSANATISGSGIAVDCANVATRYFFRVRLGDVNALGCLASCASTPGISAFNSGSGTSYRGSGSQVGAFSVDPITEFTSSSNPSAFTVASGNPRRLTFANDGAGYGGNFTQRYQIPDYWAGATTSAPQTVGTSSSNVITNGDVFVNGNSAVSSVGVGNVPGLRWVIAKNIYILGSLPVLDGVYIAKENIYTCASGFSATPRSQMAAQCATALTVRGSLIAGGSVKLQRTAGSLSTTPAEIIEYNPFVWIQGVNPTSPLPTSTSGKLDFITTLPPIL